MKISIVVSVPEKKGDYRNFVHTLEKLVLLGYDGVELAVQNPRKINAKKIKDILERSGLKVSAIATGSAFTQEHLSLSSPDGAVRDFAVSRIKDQISFAYFLGPNIKVIIGLIRGYINYPNNFPALLHIPVFERDKSFSRVVAYLVKSLRECDAFANRYGVTLVLEAVNRYEMDFLNSLEETARFLRDHNLASIKVHADTFHMNIEEKSIPESLRRAGRRLGYVHVADSNRMAPGQGNLDFAEIVRTLKEIGYNGWLSVEVVPLRPDFDTVVRQSIFHLRSLGV